MTEPANSEKTIDNSNLPDRDFQHRLYVALILLLLPLLFFFAAVKGDLLLAYRDSMTYSLPVKALVGRLLAEGNLPLWNPFAFSGMPLLAALQAGVLYPPNWVFALLPAGTAMNFVVITTYHLALIGAYLFARKLGLTRTGALLTGISFTFGGFLISQIDLTNYIQALVWLPWILFALEGLYQSVTQNDHRQWYWISFGSACIALQTFAGTPQATYQTALVGVPYGLFLLTRNNFPLARRWRFLTSALLMAVCGTLLSAIQLLPARELQLQSERAVISYEFYAAWSFEWRRILTMIFPFFFGAEHREFYSTPVVEEGWALVSCYGYAGLSAIVLGLVAIFASLRKTFGWRRDVWFWVVIAIASIALALGDNLPFGLNHLLYQIPVHNLFRCSYRHLFQFNFAIAMLAGIGASALTQFSDPAEHQRILRRNLRPALAVFAVLLTLTTLAWLLFDRFFSDMIPPATRIAHTLAQPEAWVPLSCATLTLLAVWLYARRTESCWSFILLTVTMLDLIALTMGLSWRVTPFEAVGLLNDPPAIRFLKEREPDLNSFRMLSYSAVRYPPGYGEIGYQHLPGVYGLQTIGGYDPMMPLRTAAIAGDLSVEGTVRDRAAINAGHQGLNLLNVKYLLRYEGNVADSGGQGLIYHHDLPFRPGSVLASLRPGDRYELDAGGFVTTDLGILSSLIGAVNVPQDTVVARLRIHNRDGSIAEQNIRAGRETAEAMYNRVAGQPSVKHQRPQILESFAAEPAPVHNYVTRCALARQEISFLEIETIHDQAEMLVFAITLQDANSGQARVLTSPRLPPERWRKAASVGAVGVYENLRCLPRAWFVNQVKAIPGNEILRTIRAGKLPDGSAFDPSTTALLEAELMRDRSLPIAGGNSNALVKVTRYEPNRIELETDNPQAGFLLLSEIWMPGWQAQINDVKARIERADYVLRGIAVPAGRHRVTLSYRPASFLNGAMYFFAGLLFLAIGTIVEFVRGKRRAGSF